MSPWRASVCDPQTHMGNDLVTNIPFVFGFVQLDIDWSSIAQKLHPNVYLSISPLVLKPPHQAPPSAALEPARIPDVFLLCSPDRLLVESDSADLRRSEQGCWDVICVLARGREGWELNRKGFRGREPKVGPLAVDDEMGTGRDEDEEAIRIRRVVRVLSVNWMRWIGGMED